MVCHKPAAQNKPTVKKTMIATDKKRKLFSLTIFLFLFFVGAVLFSVPQTLQFDVPANVKVYDASKIIINTKNAL